MALRAGYYGIKRGLKAKLAEIAGAWDETVLSIFPRNEQAIVGASNLLDVDANTSVQFTKNDAGQMSNHTTDSLNKLDFMIQGRKGSTFVKYLVGSQSGHNYITTTGKHFFKFTIADADDINTLYIGHKGNTNNVTLIIPFNCKGEFYFSADFVGIDPSQQDHFIMGDIMVSVSEYTPYAPFAKTNQQLTVADTDQKTAINAIITAATGAADFAAFKAAMEAITPVTRSLSREASPEDVPEEVIEEEKPVTKKTTRKTTVKEGE